MLDHLIGLVLLIFGISSSPTSLVLGDNTTSELSTNTQGTLSFGGIQAPVGVQSGEHQYQTSESAIVTAQIQYQTAHKVLLTQMYDAKKIYATQTKIRRDLHALLQQESTAFDALIQAYVASAAAQRHVQRQVFNSNVDLFVDSGKKQKTIDIQNRILNHVDTQIQNIRRQLNELTSIIIDNTVDVALLQNKKSATEYTALVQESLMRLEETKADLYVLSQRPYIIEVTSEANIKNDALWTIDSANEDIASVLGLLANARKTVSVLIQTRTIVLGEPYLKGILR